LGRGWGPTPKKTFFPIFVFLQHTSKKSRFGDPQFFWVGGPSPEKITPQFPSDLHFPFPFLPPSSMPQTRDRLKKSCESCGCLDSEWMLAMIKCVACSPPGKIIFSTLFCRNFSDFRLKACMKALKALYSASWTQTENVFRLTATLPSKEPAVAGGAWPEAGGRRGQAFSLWFRYRCGLLMRTPSGMGRFGDFCDFIANILTILLTAIGRDHCN